MGTGTTFANALRPAAGIQARATAFDPRINEAGHGGTHHARGGVSYSNAHVRTCFYKRTQHPSIAPLPDEEADDDIAPSSVDPFSSVRGDATATGHSSVLEGFSCAVLTTLST